MDKDRFLCGAVGHGASVKMTPAVSHLRFLPKKQTGLGVQKEV